MIRVSNYVEAITASGTYCQISAAIPPNIPPAGAQNTLPQIVASATIYATPTGTVSGGTLQPVIQGTDGTYRNYGAAIAGASGAIIQITTPIRGVAMNIPTNLTGGGTMFIEIDAIIV